MTLTMPPPNARQREFFTAGARYIAYGGARGGGKSWAVRWKAALLAARWQGIKLLILRRTYPDLIKNHIEPLRELLEPLGAVYRDKDKTLWLGKSQIIFGYCDNDNDLRRYQGNEYDVIFIDEATQFKWEWFDKLKACVRGVNGFPKHIYLTCNPGDIGHYWVRRLFIDRDFLPNERPEDYVFIPATVYDNSALMESDPEYVRNLESLSDGLREAWLLGRWDVFAGQYFTEWDPTVHVIADLAPPPHWRRYAALDYGLDMLAAYLIAVDERGRAYVLREVYQSGLIISDAAEAVKGLCAGEQVFEYFAPPDLWNSRQDTGKSAAEIFGECGVYLSKAKNERIAGWMDMHEWLKPQTAPDGTRYAGLRICKGCRELIRCLPQLQFDDKRPNDAATEPHEITHAPDAIRYFCAGRPFALPPEMPERPPLPFPLRENAAGGGGGFMEW